MGYVLKGTCSLGGRVEVLGRVRESLEALRWGRRRAVLTIALGAGLVCTAFPAASVASTASIKPPAAGEAKGRVSYVADSGEVNNVTVDLSGGHYTITDTGVAAIKTEAGCTAIGNVATWTTTSR
jgi:nitrous oxide reductase